MRYLKFGFSPCPNDTFIFFALVEKKVKIPDFEVEPVICDVEELNTLVRKGQLHISKISIHLWAYVQKDYILLHTGGAFGVGCGPVLVSLNTTELDSIKSVAVPGLYTTATLLLKIFLPHVKDLKACRYDEVIPKVLSQETDAGLIIHEARFVYELYGLKKLLDLGELWEQKTGLPIPLGGVVIKKELEDIRFQIEHAIRESLDYAIVNFRQTWDFIKTHAKETKDEVIRKHIGLYVNPYTRDLGDLGKRAIEKLIEMGRKSKAFYSLSFIS